MSDSLSAILKAAALTNLGCHSTRKGVATFASSGVVDTCNIIVICRRMNHAMGAVKDAYFKMEKAGDQYLGRIVAGLPVTASDFAVLPPHFVATAQINSVCIQQFGKKANNNRVFQMMLASLVFHYDFLCAHLYQLKIKLF